MSNLVNSAVLTRIDIRMHGKKKDMSIPVNLGALTSIDMHARACALMMARRRLVPLRLQAALLPLESPALSLGHAVLSAAHDTVSLPPPCILGEPLSTPVA